MSYFKPLRRKLGVVTLVMAVLSVAIWARSYRSGEYIACDFLRINSEEGSVSFGNPNGDRIWGTFAVSPRRGFSNHFDIAIPYSCVAVPLVALSAWLLLSKPRPATKRESSITTAN